MYDACGVWPPAAWLAAEYRWVLLGTACTCSEALLQRLKANCGPGHPELSKSHMDMASKLFTFTIHLLPQIHGAAALVARV